ncbi:MAG TPA: NADPH-dependent FMN reductase, partial [Archangium sp.]
MKVFAFSGSLRTGSFNTTLLNLAVPLLREKGVEVDLWDFRAAQVPIYDPDTSDMNPPASLVDAKARIRAANGLLVVTPEYNRGLPGALKNLFDFLSRPP